MLNRGEKTFIGGNNYQNRKRTNKDWKKKIEEEAEKPFDAVEIEGILDIIEAKVNDGRKSALDAIRNLEMKILEIEKNGSQIAKNQLPLVRERLMSLKRKAVLIYLNKLFSEAETKLKEIGDSTQFRKIYFDILRSLERYKEYLGEDKVAEFEEKLKKIKTWQ